MFDWVMGLYRARDALRALVDREEHWFVGCCSDECDFCGRKRWPPAAMQPHAPNCELIVARVAAGLPAYA